MPNKDSEAPDIKLVEKICSISNNESFQNNRFFKYLKKYETDGLHVKRKKPITPKIIDHYRRIEKRRIKNSL